MHRLSTNESEERLRLALEATALGTWDWNPLTGELSWDPRCRTLFGLPEDAALGYDVFISCVHPDDRPQVESAIAEAMRPGSSGRYACEFKLAARGAEGTRWVKSTGRVYFDDAGRAVRFIGTVQDITDRKLAEERSLAATRVAETLSNLALTLASELERDKLVQRVTDEATQLTGAAFGALFFNVTNESGDKYLLYTISGVPRSAFEQFPMPRNTAIFAPTFSGQRVVRYDDVTQARSYGHNPPHHGMPRGHVPVKSYLAVPVKSRSGEVLGGLFFGHPEPARFTVEHERLIEGLAAHAAVALDNARLYEQARAAVRVRDEFLSIASHELKTPLTPIAIRLSALRRKIDQSGELPIPAKEVASTIDSLSKQMKRLSSLVDGLLDVSRVSFGKLQLLTERADLAHLVREVVARFEQASLQAKSPIRLEAPPKVEGEWDSSRVEQVVTNLLSNALKYGAGAPIVVRLEHVGDEAIITITDAGIGIEPEALPRLFRKFERAASAKNYGGLGLGLFISRQLIEAMGGNIAVVSELGKGSSFAVRLPVRPGT